MGNMIDVLKGNCGSQSRVAVKSPARKRGQGRSAADVLRGSGLVSQGIYKPAVMPPEYVPEGETGETAGGYQPSEEARQWSEADSSAEDGLELARELEAEVKDWTSKATKLQSTDPARYEADQRGYIGKVARLSGEIAEAVNKAYEHLQWIAENHVEMFDRESLIQDTLKKLDNLSGWVRVGVEIARDNEALFNDIKNRRSFLWRFLKPLREAPERFGQWLGEIARNIVDGAAQAAGAAAKGIGGPLLLVAALGVALLAFAGARGASRRK